MQCPVCPGTELVMSDRQGVEIDYCPRCRGVWLDRGELDKILDRASRELEARRPDPRAAQPQQGHPLPSYPPHQGPQYGGAAHGNYRRDDDSVDEYPVDYRRRKKSWWMEIFD